ncbi:putative endonuclease [Chryseobacterium soldanellicola]|uniref:Putative endonuclease n=1 Tax=Chryseobacterium soldanellicola TaxID=311333 RepID=A0A1H1E2P9_9FLAO|nr:GIY-YIG nuclease family protein [Chryseobacterium soldanellicola]SDQ83035.1 putative endonuclease [Chryseobacterium soldanellicola]
MIKIMIELNDGIYKFYVYILTNKSRRVLYTGVTNNLHLRLAQHKNKINPNSFTAKYNTCFLIYYESFGWIQKAIEREKEIKLLKRDNKFKLIRNFNPNLEFLNYLFQ